MAIVSVRKAIVAAGMTIVSIRKPIVTFGTAAVTLRNGFGTAGMTKETAGMSIVGVRNDAVGRRKHKNHLREAIAGRREERSRFIHHARHLPLFPNKNFCLITSCTCTPLILLSNQEITSR